MSIDTQTETIIKPGQVPATTMKMLTGELAPGGRAAGIFTKDDLIATLLYVREARRLPQDLTQIEAELGGTSTGISGLEPQDILALYQKIYVHANDWTTVEQSVRRQASSLDASASEILSWGHKILEVIGAMDISDQLKTIQDAGTLEINSPKDLKIKEALPQLLSRLRLVCEREQKATDEVLTLVLDYKTEITGGTTSAGTTTTGLEPEVADKKERAKKADLGEKITSLQTEIDRLGTEIDQLKQDYDKYVGLAFTGAVGGIIGLAITGGIFGAKAEEARKQKNEKIAEKIAKSAELAKDQAIQGILNKYATKFTDLGFRLLDAQQALEHLSFVWTDLLARIDASVAAWADVTKGDMLMTFTGTLTSIVDPWEYVGDKSRELAKIWDAAIQEFKRTYAV